jgi:diguanylate cyclase (GGDEF)-like protein
MQDALRADGEDREEAARMRAAIAASGDILYHWDLSIDRLDWCRGASELLGIGGLELGIKGEAFERRLNPEDVPARRMALASHMASQERFDIEYRIRADNGGFTWVHDRGAAKFGADGKPLSLSGILRVVTARKEAQARLDFLTSYDELTGHYNRNRLRESLDHALAYAARYKVTGAYLAIGIDHLSMFSEAYDYRTVNQILIEVGNRLDRCLRASDVVGRAGDEAFGVVLAQCSAADLQAAAEKVLEAVRGRAVETPQGPISVTVSIGAVVFPDGACTGHEVMANSEAALHSARQHGCDSFVSYRRTDDERRDHRRHVEIFEDVQRALKSDRLLFAFQPIVAASTHEVAFHECLLRMRSEDGQLVTAAAFVPIVEQLGLIRVIDRKALELAVAELHGDREIVLALNISSMTAFDRAWFRMLVSFVKGRPDIASRLIIEITETSAVSDVDEMARFVLALRELGCKVALDDFGAGYTSFRHLKALTIDVVKIDGAFSRSVAESVDNQLFIRTLVSLADGFGLGTVAECVETAADAETLTKSGITYLQGWHFGKPTVEPAWRNALVQVARDRPRLIGLS